MTNRLTPEALDALLAEHHSCCGEAPTCEKPHCMATYCNSNWPCALYLLASEVRDARPFEHCWASELEAARKVVAEMREMVRECDSTITWRNERGMRPATDISIFAPTALSGVIKIKRYFEQALREHDRVMEEQR